jgi:hypothetical protein
MKLSDLCDPVQLDIFKVDAGTHVEYQTLNYVTFERQPLFDLLLKFLWESAYMQQVRQVRDLQKAYYRHPSKERLVAAKEAEATLDAMLRQVEKKLERTGEGSQAKRSDRMPG